MKKLLFLILSTVIAFTTNAQNIILNPSFEQGTNITNGNNLYELNYGHVTDWVIGCGGDINTNSPYVGIYAPGSNWGFDIEPTDGQKAVFFNLSRPGITYYYDERVRGSFTNATLSSGSYELSFDIHGAGDVSSIYVDGELEVILQKQNANCVTEYVVGSFIVPHDQGWQTKELLFDVESGWNVDAIEFRWKHNLSIGKNTGGYIDNLDMASCQNLNNGFSLDFCPPPNTSSNYYGLEAIPTLNFNIFNHIWTVEKSNTPGGPYQPYLGGNFTTSSTLNLCGSLFLKGRYYRFTHETVFTSGKSSCLPPEVLIIHVNQNRMVEFFSESELKATQTDDLHLENNITAPTETKLNIYPNPVKGFFNIELDIATFENSQAIHATLYNLSGRVMMHREINEKATRMETEMLNSGIYILELKDETGTAIRKKITVVK